VLPVYDFIFASHGKLDDRIGISSFLSIRLYYSHTITSPPYWNILSQKRTADSKNIRDYGDTAEDLAKIPDYGEFLRQLSEVFRQVLVTLKPGAYCIVNVMDLRKKNKFYPFHSDIAKMMEEIGFIYDDLIIWDRRHEYNNLRPLGYPSVFRINKVHEYLLIFQKEL